MAWFVSDVMSYFFREKSENPCNMTQLTSDYSFSLPVYMFDTGMET